jgi:hypothetical protein
LEGSLSDWKRSTLEDMMRAAQDELVRLTGKEILSDLAYDDNRGIVTLEGLNCTNRNGLCMLGFCPQCSQEVSSRPIKRLADIHTLSVSFSLARHLCMDV